MSKGYTIYGIDTSAEGGGYFATLKEAKKAAREEVKETGWACEVEKFETVPITKHALLAILNTNGGSWCASSKSIITYKGKDQ